jgi:nucleoside-diphosphate-sugar epimerase
MKNIMIYGGTGWLGRATLSYFENNYDQFSITLVSSINKSFTFKDKVYKTLSASQFKNLEGLNFDYFFNYGFLTGNKVNSLSKKEYISETNQIIEATNSFIYKNQIKNALLTSSGAVYWKNTDKETSYSIQKNKQEHEFTKTCTDMNVNYSIARIFGVLAKQYNFNFKYAFTDFLYQAKNIKSIKIDSPNKVIRSYLIFEDLLEYFMKSEESLTFDAWNKNLDIYDLAKLISKIYECSLHVSDEYFINKTDNQYMSEDFYFMNLFKKSTDAIIENRITEIIKYTEHKDNQIEYLG